MAEQIPDDQPGDQLSDHARFMIAAAAPKPKRKRVRRKKSGDMLDPYEYLATEFGKELVAPVDALPADCQWYAWKGPADAAAMFFDTRKFERFDHIAQLTKMPEGATGACVFF